MTRKLSVQNALTLEPNVKALAGEKSWTDFVFEGRIALRSNEKDEVSGSAGLPFRVTSPEENLDDLRGCGVTFNRSDLISWYYR